LVTLCLNSLWGKLAQRQDFNRTQYFAEPAPYFKLMCNEKKEVLAVMIIAEDLVAVTWRPKNDYLETSPMISIALGAWTTACSRLHLLETMESLGNRVLYCDTDSVFFTAKDGEWMPKCEEFLGCLTNEIKGDGHITEFVTGGAKQYGYKEASIDGNQKIELKIRGFRLNYAARQELTYERFKAAAIAQARSGQSDKIDVVFPRIERLRDCRVVTKQIRKTYSCVFDKRVIDRDTLMTYPYGY
jgi:hypothetical protein